MGELNKTYRYESKRRYYVAKLSIDLLGDYVVDIATGGLFNRLGHVWTTPVKTEEEGAVLLADIDKKRRLRKYVLMDGPR